MIPAERQTVRIARCAGCDAHKKKFIRPEVDMGRGLMSRTHAALGGLVMLCLPLTALLAQSATVTGVVTSEAGQPMERACLLYTSDAADERSSVDLGGRR